MRHRYLRHPAWILLAIFCLGASLRVSQLAERPVHTDEAVNAFEVGQILEGAGFRYDPSDYHGPLFFALMTGVARFAGCDGLPEMDERTLRIPSVLFSLLFIPLCFLLARVAGVPIALGAAGLWAVDPVAVYYGRYAIHESLFVALTLAFILCFARALETGLRRWQAAAGLVMGLMIATKETAVISLGAALCAAFLVPELRRKLTFRAGLMAATVALLVTLPFFTWGFTNLKGVIDLLAAGPNYLSRAAGHGHEKPWFHYFVWMSHLHSAPLLAACAMAGTWLAWRGRDAFGRFLSLYGGLLFFIYMAIPYKSPWLMLNFTLPLVLLAATLFAAAWRRSRGLAIAGVAALVLAALMDARELVFRRPAGEANPLAYSHTQEDLTHLTPVIEAWRARVGREPRIAVVARDPWPLPWYLRRHPLVGYWTQAGSIPDADLLVLDPEFAGLLVPEQHGWRPSIFGQRPGALLLLYRRVEDSAR